MGWQETILSDEEISKALTEHFKRTTGKDPKQYYDDISENDRVIAKAQAKPSYKAGEKRIIDWVEASKSCRSDFMTPGEFYFRIPEAEWQTLLKELEE